MSVQYHHSNLNILTMAMKLFSYPIHARVSQDIEKGKKILYVPSNKLPSECQVTLVFRYIRRSINLAKSFFEDFFSHFYFYMNETASVHRIIRFFFFGIVSFLDPHFIYTFWFCLSLFDRKTLHTHIIFAVF